MQFNFIARTRTETRVCLKDMCCNGHVNGMVSLGSVSGVVRGSLTGA